MECEKKFGIFSWRIWGWVYVFLALMQRKNRGKRKINSTKQSFCILSRESATVGIHGNVAQLVEQRPFKAMVPGSNPGVPTSIDIKKLHISHDLWSFFWFFSHHTTVVVWKSILPSFTKFFHFICFHNLFLYNLFEKSIVYSYNPKNIWQKEM